MSHTRNYHPHFLTPQENRASPAAVSCPPARNSTRWGGCWLLTVGFALCLFLAAGPAWAVKSRQMIKFKSGLSPAQQEQIVAASGSTVLQWLPLVQAAAIRLPAGLEEQALEAIRTHQDVVAVEEDTPLTIPAERDGLGGAQGDLVTPTEPIAAPDGYHWNLHQIKLDKARKNYKGHGVHVAILDTGIDPTHPALTSVVTQGYNARAGEDPNDWLDRNGHGTHVAGIIAATMEDAYVRSIAPKATLYAVKVLDETGNGYLSDLINGLSWIYSHPNNRKVNVVNMSLGFNSASPLLREAIQILYNRGIVLVAAVGNADTQGASGEGAAGEGAASGTDCTTTEQIKYPAAYPETIGVGATDIFGQIAPYSLHGPAVDLVAPGGTRDYPIQSFTLQNGYGLSNGTSQATAHVTGVVTLLLSVNSALTPADILAILQETAVDLGADWEAQGAGLLDAQRAIERAQTW